MTAQKMFKISPDEALKVVQELYEKKMVTYPRTDARVLSTAVAKEIRKNISGLSGYSPMRAFVQEILQGSSWQNLAKTRYVNDKQITDHYAIVPTGQGLGSLRQLTPLQEKVYQVICRRFLSIFIRLPFTRSIPWSWSGKRSIFLRDLRCFPSPDI